jgi:6-phosphogluconolactonase (cycloisomerase 2 family)/predicted small secreted protein
MRRSASTPLLAVLAGLLAAACSDTVEPAGPDAAEIGTTVAAASQSSTGAVYLMTNAAGPNEVVILRRAANGALTAADPVATGGAGTGAGLGNQGALALTGDGRWLLVVNPGSDDVSLFRVGPHGIELTDVAPSGGDQPISVTVHGSVAYVVHAGSPNGISGLRISGGSLQPIAGSTRPLSGDQVGPAQIGFTPHGDVLVVTEKGTNMITTFTVGSDGVASAPTSYPAAGQTPFGFAFDAQGTLIVSEAFGGMPDASTVTSYDVSGGVVEVLDGPVALTETAACWIAISPNGRFAYSTNTGSGTVSGLAIGAKGSLELLDADGVTGVTGMGSGPLDAAFARGGRFLYVLSSGLAEVSAFRVGAHGDLTPLGNTPVPAGANGMAVR